MSLTRENEVGILMILKCRPTGYLNSPVRGPSIQLPGMGTGVFISDKLGLFSSIPISS